MNTVLWVLQVLIAVAFLAAGLLKVTQPKAQMRERLAWVDDFSERQVKLIGTLEVLGAIGLVVPPAIDVLPVLCPIAATGLVLTMIGAAATHVRRGELPMLAPNLVLGGIALFIAIERFGPHSF